MKRLVLIGGGHAHLAVLWALATGRPPDLETVLITPSAHQHYSGMLPSWMAGHYAAHECRIDLRPLAQVAQLRMEINLATRIDARQRIAHLADGRQIAYGLLSIDVGSEIDASWLEMAGDKLLLVKPLDAFYREWRLSAEGAWVWRWKDRKTALTAPSSRAILGAQCRSIDSRSRKRHDHVQEIQGLAGQNHNPHRESARQPVERASSGTLPRYHLKCREQPARRKYI